MQIFLKWSLGYRSRLTSWCDWNTEKLSTVNKTQIDYFLSALQNILYVQTVTS